jgi:hypothetical protein
MAMGIDFSKPLTPEERKFLDERGRYADIERMDATFGTAAPEGFDTSGDGTGPQMEPVLLGEVRAARKERLLAELAAIEQAEAADEDEEGGEVAPYESWKVPELDAEIKRRNDAGASLATGGNKDEKVARLYEDDENAES